MAIIKFTRHEQINRGVSWRYADVVEMLAEAKTGEILLNIRHDVAMAGHGELELPEFVNAWVACARHQGWHLDDGDIIDSGFIQRGQGDHPKAGPWVAYLAPGLSVKVAARRTTELRAQDVRVKTAQDAEAVRVMLAALVHDRAFVRLAAGIPAPRVPSPISTPPTPSTTTPAEPEGT